MKRVRLVKLSFSDDDLHFMWKESAEVYNSQTKHCQTAAEAKKITKMEAAKLLFIVREE